MNMRIWSSLSIGIAGLSLTANAALADQCAYISKPEALMAAAHLQLGQTIYNFCENCGDRRPRPVTVQALSVGTVDYQDYWQVSVNGRGIDLAYTYLNMNPEQPRQQTNLALVVGCPTQGATPIISP